MMSRVASLAALVILAARAASAQPSPAVRQLCEADYHRLCATVAPAAAVS
jgi:hypothetical protein